MNINYNRAYSWTLQLAVPVVRFTLRQSQLQCGARGKLQFKCSLHNN